MPVYLEEVSAQKAINGACEGNSAMAKHYQVPLKPDGSGDHRLIADPVRLRQILDNFISNAIKFSPVGGSVRIWSATSQEGQIRITVADEGDGVPETFEARLFQRFEQAESGTDRAKAGTGLGLAITRELARLMGGEVGYYYDNGAHFWVELPESMPKNSKAGGEHENA